MQVQITARHLNLTPALADYIQKRLSRVGRHFASVLTIQVVLEVEKLRHIAEVVVHANGHHDFRANAESVDLYAAVDLVAEKLHKHMARRKDKRVRGRRGQKPTKGVPFWPAGAETNVVTDSSAPLFTRVKRITPRPMTFGEAVEEMERSNFAFYVFINDGTLTVAYKQKDGTYGLLEPNVLK